MHTFKLTMKYFFFSISSKYASYFVFPLFTDTSPVPMLREIGSEPLPSAGGLLISLLVWKGLYRLAKLTLTFFVIKKKKPSSR